MKLFPKWKKIVFTVFAAFIFIRIVYILNGEIEKEYYTSKDIILDDAKEIPCRNVSQTFLLNGEKCLNSIEFAMNGIPEEESGTIVLTIQAEDALLYQAKISAENITNCKWKKVYINLPAVPGKEYKISFDARDFTQIPTMLLTEGDNVSLEAVVSYAAGKQLDGQAAVKFGYMREPVIIDKLMNIAVCLIWLFIAAIILYYFESICKSPGKVVGGGNGRNTEVIIIISELFLCQILLYSGRIEFQEPTKVIFYIISICSAWKWREKRAEIRKLTNTYGKKTGLVLLYLYGSFSLAGQRILVYPLNLEITPDGLFVFIITAIWFVPVMDTIIYLYRHLSKGLLTKTDIKYSNFKFVFICVIFLLLPAGFNLYANNPGISSSDTLTCMVTNARHLRGMFDWHPAFYCMVLRVILSFWDSTYAVILVQYFFWCYVVIEGLLYLRERGLNQIFLLTIAFLSGICAGNFLYLNTIWKDIPYTLSLLWSVILLGKLALDFNKYKRKWFIYIELFVSLLGIFFYRKNGMVSFLIIAVSMMFFLKQNKKMWMTLAAAVLAIFTIKGPVYSCFEIEDAGKHGIYIGLSQDILGAYYAGGEVSEKTLQMINVMTSYNTAEYEYTPTWARQSYDLDVQPVEFIISYLDTFIRNPVSMARAAVAREDALWNIFPGEDAVLGCVNRTGTIEKQSEWNQYYPKRVYNSFYNAMGRFTAYTADTQWIAALQWRCGVFTLLGLAAILTMVWSAGYKKYLLISAPIAGHIISLLLSTGWSEFRYFWPLNLMNLFLLLFMILVLNGNSGE